MRQFETGATRDTDEGKFDYEGFYSPLVVRRFAEYMDKHRVQADGNLRDSDNWQKGMPQDAYMKSGWRHFMDWWLHHRGLGRLASEALEDALCALLFNVQGYLYEVLRVRMEESLESRHEAPQNCPGSGCPWDSPTVSPAATPPSER